MEEQLILEKLQKIFRDVFSSQSLNINPEMTANDIDEWDSLSHMLLITQVEAAFSIKFKLKDLNKMRKIGDMIELIQSKL